MQAGSVSAMRELLFPTPIEGLPGALPPLAADPNRMGVDGSRPLHRAVQAALEGQAWGTDMVELLVQAPGIDLQARDDAGRRAIDLLPPQPRVPALFGPMEPPTATQQIRAHLATPSDALFHLNRYSPDELPAARADLPSFGSREAAVAASMGHIEAQLAKAPADRPVVICAADTHGDMHAAEIVMKSMRLLSRRAAGASSPGIPMFFAEVEALGNRAPTSGVAGPSHTDRFEKALEDFRTSGTDPLKSMYPHLDIDPDQLPDEMDRRSASVNRQLVALKASAAALGVSCDYIERSDYPMWKAKEARQGRQVNESDYQQWRAGQDHEKRLLARLGAQQANLLAAFSPDREDLQVANVDVFLGAGGSGCVLWPGIDHLAYLREALADRCTFIAVAPIGQDVMDVIKKSLPRSGERISYCISHPEVFAFQTDFAPCNAGRFKELMQSFSLDGGGVGQSGQPVDGPGSSASSGPGGNDAGMPGSRAS